MVWQNRLRWYGYILIKDDNNWLKNAHLKLMRPNKKEALGKLVDKDMLEMDLQSRDAMDRRQTLADRRQKIKGY